MSDNQAKLLAFAVFRASLLLFSALVISHDGFPEFLGWLFFVAWVWIGLCVGSIDSKYIFKKAADDGEQKP